MFEEIVDVYGYDASTVLVNPRNFGFPCDRQRKFMVAVKRSRLRVVVPFSKDNVTSLFHKRCMTDARMYFRAPRSDVKAHLSRIAKARFLPDGQWNMEDLLDFSKRASLDGYRRLAWSQRRSFFVCDLNQRPAFWKKATPFCGALLRTGQLFGVTTSPKQCKRVINRPMLMCEMFGVQGLPVLLPRVHPLTSLLPKRLRFSMLRAAAAGKGRISEVALKSMAGNGQHISSIGCALVLTLLGTELKSVQPSHGHGAEDCDV
eukprot:123312-Lingulodinium_polyedra.AAC.1